MSVTRSSCRKECFVIRVNLREDVVTNRIDAWLVGLFDHKHCKTAIATVLDATTMRTPIPAADAEPSCPSRRVLDVEARLSRHLSVVEVRPVCKRWWRDE